MQIKIMAFGWCLFRFRYLIRYGKLLEAFMWLGWSFFSTGENIFARCWYSGCSFIVHSIKYVLYLRICGGRCAFSMFGIGPGLISISPLLSSCSELLV